MAKPVALVPPAPPLGPSEVNLHAEYAAGAIATSLDVLVNDLLRGYAVADNRQWQHLARVEVFAALAKNDPRRSIDVPEVVADLKAFADACVVLSTKMKLVGLRARARCAAVAAEKAQAEADRAAALAAGPAKPLPAAATQPEGEA
jgi:hypothetical protein